MLIETAILEMKKTYYGETERVKHAKQLAVAALTKQLPVKPFPENRYFGIGKCPMCGAVFMDKSTNYCGNCGQALDWGEDNGNV